jgi:hypothetical protein
MAVVLHIGDHTATMTAWIPAFGSLKLKDMPRSRCSDVVTILIDRRVGVSTATAFAST